MNPFKALASRFPAMLKPAEKVDWDKFVDESIAQQSVQAGVPVSCVNGVLRFRCPTCGRGVRIPEAAIGKRLICAFCRTAYLSSFEEPEPNGGTHATELAKWLPSAADVRAAAQRASDAVRKDARVQNATAAILSTSNALVTAAAPLTAVAAGAASVALPGAGEVLSGRTRWGFCTMAAFFGATAAASAAGGAWIALPIAIRVLSTTHAVTANARAAKGLSESLTENAEEARAVAAELAREAQRMDDEAFEKEMQRREAEELQAVEVAASRRVILVPVAVRPPTV